MAVNKVRRVIRLSTLEPHCVSAVEYERLKKEIEARYIAGDITLGDRIVATLLREHESRYNEIKDYVDADAEDDIDRGPV